MPPSFWYLYFHAACHAAGQTSDLMHQTGDSDSHFWGPNWYIKSEKTSNGSIVGCFRQNPTDSSKKRPSIRSIRNDLRENFAAQTLHPLAARGRFFIFFKKLWMVWRRVWNNFLWFSQLFNKTSFANYRSTINSRRILNRVSCRKWSDLFPTIWLKLIKIKLSWFKAAVAE